MRGAPPRTEGRELAGTDVPCQGPSLARQQFLRLTLPPAQAGRCSVLRRSLRHGSPKGQPGPLYVQGGVVVAVQAGPTVRAGMPADGQTSTPQPEPIWLVSAGGTATTERPAHTALKLRMLKNALHPASAIDFARWWFLSRLAVGHAA